VAPWCSWMFGRLSSLENAQRIGRRAATDRMAGQEHSFFAEKDPGSIPIHFHRHIQTFEN
jgi:hypothetical protein